MDFENMTVSDLKKIAKEKGVKNITKFNKEELIAILEDLISSKEETTVLPTENEEDTPKFVEKITEEGYKLTAEGDEVVTGILEVLPDGYRIFERRKLFTYTERCVYFTSSN